MRALLGWISLSASLACLAALAQDRLAAAPSVKAGEQFLRDDCGLVRPANSLVWKSALHDPLRDRHAELPKLRATIVTTYRQLETRIEDNARLWVANQRRLEELRRAMRGLGTDDPARQVVQQQMAVLRRAAVPPAQLGGVADVRAALVGLSQARTDLQLTLVWIRQQTSELVAHYERLAADARFRAALVSLGKDMRLASAQPLVDAMQDLPAYEELLQTDAIPCHLLGGTVRFTAIANETTPVTFSWRENREEVILPASLAKACGLQVPRDAPTRSIAIQNEKVAARQATLPYLQLGTHLARDVPVWILPADREDLGAEIGSRVSSELYLVPELERLRLVVRQNQ